MDQIILRFFFQTLNLPSSIRPFCFVALKFLQKMSAFHPKLIFALKESNFQTIWIIIYILILWFFYISTFWLFLKCNIFSPYLAIFLIDEFTWFDFWLCFLYVNEILKVFSVHRIDWQYCNQTKSDCDLHVGKAKSNRFESWQK